MGTGSIVAQTSSGIEPIFCTSYTRRVKQDDGESFREYKVYHPLIQRVFGDDEDLPDYVVTAHENRSLLPRQDAGRDPEVHR